MNFVMTSAGKFVEVQASAEHQVFDDSELNAMIQLARAGIETLLEKQRAALGLEVPSRYITQSRGRLEASLPPCSPVPFS